MRRRRHPRGRARARAGRRDWHARNGQSGGSGDLEHRATGRTRLPPRLQSAASARVAEPMSDIILHPGSTTLAEWRAIYRGAGVALGPSCWLGVDAGAAAVARLVAGGDPVD